MPDYRQEHAASRLPPGRYSEMRRDLQSYLFRLFVRAPKWVSRAHINALTAVGHVARPVPGNPVRESLESVARIAARDGAAQDSRGAYRAFVAQLRQAGLAYLDVMRDGPPAVDRSVEVPPDVAALIEDQRSLGKGLVVTVPHNTGGILASVAFGRTFPSRVLMRNSTSEERDRMMMELFERLEVDAYLTRNTTPAGMFRASLSALRQGKVLILTLDNIDLGRKSLVEVSMFGSRIPFASWGARIALRASAPLLPAWVTWTGERFRMEAGEPIHGASLEDTMQHYAAYFERKILEQPEDWLFLGHKRWKRALRVAADA